LITFCGESDFLPPAPVRSTIRRNLTDLGQLFPRCVPPSDRIRHSVDTPRKPRIPSNASTIARETASSAPFVASVTSAAAALATTSRE
jgi:hypothetical protein